MAKTHIDQLVDYPAKVIKKISEDDYCVGLILNKQFNSISENDYDEALDKNIFDYQYVDGTVETSGAYIWVEMEINKVDNVSIKDNRIYVVVACHKDYMKLNPKIFKGIQGNRRDNIIRFVDRVLNGQVFMGIGALKLESVKTMNSYNGFTLREITYSLPDFNLATIDEQ